MVTATTVITLSEQRGNTNEQGLVEFLDDSNVGGAEAQQGIILQTQQAAGSDIESPLGKRNPGLKTCCLASISTAPRRGLSST
mmetsp:Transcript_6761/g.9911  ORF Transcript_6761/g.9911 Transcript_6761/m.9911 type:complete len:83 (+) Transcript_6761:384-632(+)